MKAILFLGLMTMSSLSFALSVSVDAENTKIQACAEKMSVFFKDIDLDGDYYRGQNNAGKCFIYYYPTNAGFNSFLNSKASNYISNLEISITREENARFTNEIKRCELTATSLIVQNKHRMPRTIYFRSDGALAYSPSIFDHVENQTLQLTKDKRGKLVSAAYSTPLSGQVHCFFQ